MVLPSNINYVKNIMYNIMFISRRRKSHLPTQIKRGKYKRVM